MQDRNIEQIVLGTLLGDAKALPFGQLLETEDFDDPHHQIIFQVMAGMFREGRHPSPAIIGVQFANDLDSGGKSLKAYLRELASHKCVARDQLGNYIRALKEYRGRRVMAQLGAQMAEVAVDPGVEVAPFVDEAREQLTKVLAGIRQNQITSRTAKEWGDMVLDAIEQDRTMRLIPTGIPLLDKLMGGWPRGELTIIAGRPSMGKSTLALSSMRQMAAQGRPSLFFSMEMGGNAMMMRVLSDAVWNSQTPIEYERIIQGNLPQHERDRLRGVVEQCSKLPFVLDEARGLSVSDMAMKARRVAERMMLDGNPLQALWFDHLGHIRAGDRYRGNRVSEIGEVTKGVLALARELDCAAILLSQLNRQVEQRDDNRPQMSDLRESGNIEEDADTILFCYRHFYYLERMAEPRGDEERERHRNLMENMRNILDAICAKRRNGRVFTARLNAFMGSNAIRSLVA